MQFAFTHAMIGEVVYQSLLRSERKRLHQLVGDAVEGLYIGRIDEFVPTLAYHFERGGDVSRAVKYLYHAGMQSMEVFALDQARECYLKALRLSAGDAEKGIEADFPQRLREALGDVHYLSSEYEGALLRYEEALQMEQDQRRQAALYRKRGKVLEKWGRYDQAQVSFERGLEVLQTAFDEREAGQLYSGLSLVHFHKADLEAASRLGELALQLNEEAEDEWGTAEACNNLGVILARRGEYKGAHKRYLQAQKIYKRMNNRYGLATCCNNRGVLALDQGEYDSALRWFRKGLRLFEALGNQHGVARAYDNMSQAFYRKGNPKRSEECLEKAVKIVAELSADHAAPSAELWQSGIW